MSTLQMTPTLHSLELHEIFEAARADPEPPRELLCTFVNDGDEFYATSDTLTLVMNRDIRGSVQIASGLALKIAQKFPERNVLLINTYASRELLIEGFVNAILLGRLKLPPDFQRLVPDARPDQFEAGAELPSPNNLRVLDSPTSTLTPATLELELEQHAATVLILNSFEFAGFTTRRRMQLAESILELKQKLGLTVLVFSHEMRPEINPYTGGRGPLGLLNAFAGSIWKLMDPFEKKKWVKPFQNR